MIDLITKFLVEGATVDDDGVFEGRQTAVQLVANFGAALFEGCLNFPDIGRQILIEV